MRYTTKIGTYFGIPVKIHFTFPLILVAFGVDAWVRGGWTDAAWAVSLVIAVFTCVVLHEFGHSLQARRYGIRVRDIVLLPIGGMARAERIPENPRQEIIVAISGPLVNFVLAAIFFAIIWARPHTPIDITSDFLGNLLAINIVLGTFNLIPAFPMDGGRILRGVLAMRMPYLTATRYAKNVGQVIAILFVLVGFLDARFLMLPLIAVFVFFGAISEEKMVRVRVSLDSKKVRDFVPPHVGFLSVDDTIESAAAMIERTGAWALPVTSGEGALAGAVDATELAAAMSAGRGDEPLNEIAITGFPLIDGDAPASNAYYILKKRRLPLAGVIEGGRYVGLVNFNDLAKEIA